MGRFSDSRFRRYKHKDNLSVCIQYSVPMMYMIIHVDFTEESRMLRSWFEAPKLGNFGVKR